MKTYRHGALLEKEIRETVVPKDAVALWHLGQACVLVKSSAERNSVEGIVGSTCVIDPYLTNSIEDGSPGTEFVRAFDPPLLPEQLQGVSLVLITHHHDDHMDLETLKRLHDVSPETMMVVPAPHMGRVVSAGIARECVIPASAGHPIEHAGFSVLPVAAAHTDYETDSDGNHLYLGYLISTGEVSVYHSGDTVVTDELVKTLADFAPQIAILPINGGDYQRTRRGIVGNMSAREAVDFALTIGADMLVPNHYDMFPNNRENPSHFVDYLFHQHPELKFHMCSVGERFLYMK